MQRLNKGGVVQGCEKKDEKKGPGEERVTGAR